MRTFRLCIGLWIIASTTGCGYSAHRPFPSNVQTVHVEMFSTHDFRRDLEYKLTEAVTKRIEMDTNYRIAHKKNADTVLTGEIINVRQNTLGSDFRTGLPRETAATFVISFRWKDLRTGQILAERQQLPITTTYIRPVGESFFDASVRGLESVAEQLVEAMESPW